MNFQSLLLELDSAAVNGPSSANPCRGQTEHTVRRGQEVMARKRRAWEKSPSESFAEASVTVFDKPC
jgi:hypothetical protein